MHELTETEISGGSYSKFGAYNLFDRLGTRRTSAGCHFSQLPGRRITPGLLRLPGVPAHNVHSVYFCNKLVFILDFIIYIFFYLANIKILILFILFFCRKINVGSFALAAQRLNLFQCSELSLHVVLHLFPRCKGAGCYSDADVRTRSGTAVILACSLSYSTAPSGIA